MLPVIYSLYYWLYILNKLFFGCDFCTIFEPPIKLLNAIKRSEKFWSWIFAHCKSDDNIIWGPGVTYQKCHPWFLKFSFLTKIQLKLPEQFITITKLLWTKLCTRIYNWPCTRVIISVINHWIKYTFHDINCKSRGSFTWTFTENLWNSTQKDSCARVLCPFTCCPYPTSTLQNTLKITKALSCEQNIPKCCIFLIMMPCIVTNELKTCNLWTPFPFKSLDHVNVTIS